MSNRVQPRFSVRTGWDREASTLAEFTLERRRQGVPVLDLTASNPGRCGLGMDRRAVLGPLGEPGEALLEYDPQPFGRMAAREAVAVYYRRHAAAVDPAYICLTASTSEAYSFLFRLLCDPGDEVLIATPSYPLFEYLAALDDVRLVPYPLMYEHGWQIEPGAVEARIGPRTRAIALVHPNNPTGHLVGDAERAALETLCARRGLALIVDEVFLDYPWGEPARSFAQAGHPALTFVLSGLSKIAALPQMKLSWLAIFGPDGARLEARERLEIVADSFLSVSAPVQLAAPDWLESAEGVQGRIRERVAGNLRALDKLLKGTPVTRLLADGGWYAVLRIPALEGDERWAERLLSDWGVLVHPGSAFGFPDRGWVVVSLLPQPEIFFTGATGLVGSLNPSATNQMAGRSSPSR